MEKIYERERQVRIEIRSISKHRTAKFRHAHPVRRYAHKTRS